MRDDQAVFLNVPFDRGYERLFVALVAAVVALGRKPRCVLELPEGGQGRLARILEHLDSCRVSVHDLSRVGQPARFNMPFELGLACSLAHLKGPHDFIILERVAHRLDRTLSDLKRCDCYVHEGRPRLAIGAVLDAFASPAANPGVEEVHALYLDLWRAAQALKAAASRRHVFSRSLFLGLVAVGVELAVDHGFIAAA